MTAIQLNAELLRNISIIAENENLLKRAVKYLRKLVAEEYDPTLMTKDDFFAKIDRAEQQIAKGQGMEMLPNEDVASFLKRNGYDI